MPVSEFKTNLAGVIAQLDSDNIPIHVTQHGKPKAVLVQYEEYEALLDRLDDLEDALAMQQTVASPETESLSLEEYERQRAVRVRG